MKANIKITTCFGVGYDFKEFHSCLICFVWFLLLLLWMKFGFKRVIVAVHFSFMFAVITFWVHSSCLQHFFVSCLILFSRCLAWVCWFLLYFDSFPWCPALVRSVFPLVSTRQSVPTMSDLSSPAVFIHSRARFYVIFWLPVMILDFSVCSLVGLCYWDVYNDLNKRLPAGILHLGTAITWPGLCLKCCISHRYPLAYVYPTVRDYHPH